MEGSNSLVLKEKLTELFTKVGRIQFLLLALIASGVFFFGKPFILKWAGDGYDDAYIVAVMLLFSSTIAFIQNLGIEIQRAENNHRFRSIIYIVMAIFNLLITLILCPKFGIVGAAIGTSASLLLANGLVMNIYYHLRCSIDIFYFWKSIGRLSIGLILPCVFGFLLNYFTDVNSTVVLIVDILVYSAVYIVSMWFFGINQSEKNILIKPLIALKCRCRK
jgi:O-antigen/teichoic acid export membrane protein